MLTIKWIVRTDKGEVIRMYEAKSVSVAYRNEDRPPAGSLAPPWCVDGRPVLTSLLILDPNDGLSGRSFDCGTVYVMNESGATVGKYVLSDEMVATPDIPQPLVMPPGHNGEAFTSQGR